MREPYHLGDLKRDPNLVIYPNGSLKKQQLGSSVGSSRSAVP